MYKALREEVYKANMELVRRGLVVQTWGNASGIDRSTGIVAIKPSGVDYDKLKPEDIVCVTLDGHKVYGDYNPSSDTPTHLVLYKAFGSIGGVVHVHSVYATAFAQAMEPLPCFGTTHADSFYGTVPVTETMTAAQIDAGYEVETGNCIVTAFAKHMIDPQQMPAVLVASHAPFCWGKSATYAVDNAETLETVAKMASITRQLKPTTGPIQQRLLDKHFLRKHGSGAYYGQKTN